MHRLHEEDLIAHLLAKTNSRWSSLSLQMVADAPREIYFGNELLYSVKTRQILDESRYNEEDIESIKQEVGSYAFAAQYQQNPPPLSGTIIKKEYFGRYKSLPNNDYNASQSWDTASSTGEGSDYSVCITYTIINSIIYIIDVLRGRFDYPALKKQVIKLANDYNSCEIIIEDKSSGIQLLQELKKETLLLLIGVKPKRSRLERLNMVLPLIEREEKYFYLAMQAGYQILSKN